MEKETVGGSTCCTGPEWQRSFDENGNMIYEEHEKDLPRDENDNGSDGPPRVYYEKNYENGLILLESETYMNCGECDFDSTGTWKFYENGKLIRTKKFPSWQEYYQKSKEKPKEKDE